MTAAADIVGCALENRGATWAVRSDAAWRGTEFTNATEPHQQLRRRAEHDLAELDDALVHKTMPTTQCRTMPR